MNPAPFFITGLPRSRTGWMAAWLTTATSLCLHDGLLGCTNLDAFAERLAAGHRAFNGDSDSALLLYQRQLRKQFPQARWVVIQRSPTTCYQSVRKAFPDLATPRDTQLLFDRAMDELHSLEKHALCVEFEELDQVKSASDIWDHCLPGLTFDKERWQLFNGLKIEPHHDKYVARMGRQPVLPPCQPS